MKFDQLALFVENPQFSEAAPRIFDLPFDWKGSVEAAFYTVYYSYFKKQAEESGVLALSGDFGFIPPVVRPTVEKYVKNEIKYTTAMMEKRKPTPADKDRITKAKIAVRKRCAELGDILQEIPTVYVGYNPKTGKGCPTFGISPNTNLLVNLGYASLLTDEQLIGVLAHEALHVFLRHWDRLKGRTPFRLANYATDAYINSDLTDSNFHLPEGGIQAAGGRFNLQVLYVDVDVPDISIAQPQLVNLRFDLKGRNWESVFEELKEKLNVKALKDIKVFEYGDVVFDTSRNTFGVVEDVYKDYSNENNVTYTVREITEEEAKKLSKLKAERKQGLM